MKRYFTAFLFLAISGITAYGQLTSCTQTLRLARSIYEQGRLHDIPGLLERCLQSGFSQDEKTEAYKLLCLAYIYLEEPAKADEAMLNLLRTNHYFEIKPETDPAEFVALYRTFRTDPIYRIGLNLGANTTLPNVISFIPANELASEYDYGFAFQVGVTSDIPLPFLGNRLTFHPELLLLMRTFKYTNEGTFFDTTPDGQPYSREFETNGIEKQTWVSLPIVIQYKLSDKKFKPYVGLGVSADYLLAANNTFRRTKEDATSLQEQSINLLQSRNRLNISALGSVGVKAKVTGGFIVTEVRYAHGITRVNDTGSIYKNFDRIYPTGGYVDGIIKVNTLSVTVGYVYNRFNPKKIKK
jgi:hypothetical protein